MNTFVEKIFLKCIGVLALWSLASCSSVTISECLPSNPSEENREEFSGQWVTKDGVVHIKFDKKGLGHLAWLEWDEAKQAFEMQKTVFGFSELGDDYYVSVRVDGEHDDDSLYVLAQCVIAEGDLVVWAANDSVFKKLVQEGDLKGTVESGRYGAQVAIDISGAKMLQFLKGATQQNLFNYKEPLVFRKSSE